MNRKLQKIRRECLELKKQLDKKRTEFEVELDKHYEDDYGLDREIHSAKLQYDLMDDSKKDHFKRVRKAVFN